MGGSRRDKGRFLGTTAPGQEAWKIPRGRLAGQVAEGTAAFTSGNTNQGKAVPEDRAGSPGGNHPEAKRVGTARWGSRVPLGGFLEAGAGPTCTREPGRRVQVGPAAHGLKLRALVFISPF